MIQKPQMTQEQEKKISDKIGKTSVENPIFSNDTEKMLVLQSMFRGFGNKLVDEYHKYVSEDDKLSNNLVFHVTKTIKPTTKTFGPNENFKFIIEEELNNINQVHVLKDNKKYYKFIKNITLNIKTNMDIIKDLIGSDIVSVISKYLPNKYSVVIKIGGQKIFEFKDFMYETIAKKFGIKTGHGIVIPFNMPISVFHNIEVIVTSDTDHKKDISLEYDIYLYDIIDDPLKIVGSPDPCGRIDNTLYTVNIEYLMHKIQSDHFFLSSFLKFEKKSLCFYHHVNSIVIRIPKEYEKDVSILINGSVHVQLVPSYRVSEFVVYDFQFLNFSRMNYIVLWYNPIIKKTDISNDTPEYVMQVFAFHIDAVIAMRGMLGTLYS
jgi:hypothetical protein